MIRRTHESQPRPDGRRGDPGSPGLPPAGGSRVPTSGGLLGRRRSARGRVPGDPAALLEELIHPALIPLRSASIDKATAVERAIADEGVPLDQLLRQWGGAPIPSWRRRCPEGLGMLLDSFVRITRLLNELKGAGWIVPRLHPRWFRLGVDGRLRLRADDLLAGGGELGRDEWAPYLAPELLLATGDSVNGGEEAGVYSLAAILHHCLSGAPPWAGRSETEVADRLLAGAPPSPIPVEKDLPRGVAPLLQDALALDPRSRPSRFRGFAAALESAARGERPRSSTRHRSEAPGRARPGLRVLAFVAVVLLAIQGLRAGADGRERAELLDRLDAVRAVRPFPVHGEDAPVHPAAVQVLRDLHRAAAARARDPEVQVALGWVQLRAGRPGEAAESFLTARAWDPDSAAASISLGIARLEEGKHSGSLDLDRGTALPVRTARDRLLRGIGALYLHRFGDAREAFRTALEVDGPSAVLSFHLALAAHHDGAYEEATRALADARRLRPRDVWMEWLEVEGLVRRGETEAALSRIEAHRSEWLESEPLVLRAAVILERVGRTEEALRWWERTEFAARGERLGDTVRWTSGGLLVLPDRVLLELSE